MTKRELKLWRQAVWFMVQACPYDDGRVFFQMWYGSLLDME